MRKVINSFAIVSLLSLLTLHLALRGITADLDAPAYLHWYWRVGSLNQEQFFNDLVNWYSLAVPPHVFEWGFALFGWALASLGASEAMFFGTAAALSLGLKVKPLLKYCPAPLLGLLWYLSWYFILMEMNAIRAGIAAGFLLMATAAMLDRHWLRFSIHVFLATSFHISAAIGLFFPFLLWNINRLWLSLILVASIGIGYVNLVPLFSYVDIPKVEEYATLLTMTGAYEEINRFNIISLIRLAIAAILIWKLPTFKTAQSVGVRAYVVSLAIYYAFASFPAFGGRISQLLGVLDILVVPAIALMKPRMFWLPLFLLICALQFYALSIHFQLADFFYFIGEPRVVVPTGQP